MKIKCFIDDEIYEVISEDEFFYSVRGKYLGMPFYISKKDCEKIAKEVENENTNKLW